MPGNGSGNFKDMEWRCFQCDVTGPATSRDYMRLLKHRKGHHIHLVNTTSGDHLATTVRQARNKGIDIPADSPETPSDAGKSQEGGKLATVTQPRQGAIVFSFGDHKIPLDPQYLYESYLIYSDLKSRIGVDEDFSTAIRDAMTYIWRKFSHAEAREKMAVVAVESGQSGAEGG